LGKAKKENKKLIRPGVSIWTAYLKATKFRMEAKGTDKEVHVSEYAGLKDYRRRGRGGSVEYNGFHCERPTVLPYPIVG